MKRRKNLLVLTVGASALVSCAVFLVRMVTAQETQVEIAATTALLEGPAADQEGNVYFADVKNGRIMKLDAGGATTIYRPHSNGAVGLLIDPRGRLPEVEMIDIDYVNEAWDRVVKADVKYRFVIDMASLKS